MKTIQIELEKDHDNYMNWVKENGMQGIITRVHWLIHDSGLSQVEIAKSSGISTATISRMKDGSRLVEDMQLKNVMKLEKLATKIINN